MKITIHVEGTKDAIAAELRAIADDFDGGDAPAEMTTKPAKGKKAAKVEEPEEIEEEEETDAIDVGELGGEDEEAEEEPAPKKGKAAKEPTIDDVRAALKAKAEATSRDDAMRVLKKMKVKSVNDLKPSQYKEVIALCA